MKKILYLLLALPFALGFASCSDDDDLPNVTVTMNFSNAVAQDGIIYVAEADTLYLNSIDTKAMASNQSAVLTNILYYWNYVPTPNLTWGSYPLAIPIAKMPLSSNGNNILGMEATLLETDKSIAYTNIRVPIKVVPTVEDLPAGTAPGDAQLVMQIGQSRDQSKTK